MIQVDIPAGAAAYDTIDPGKVATIAPGNPKNISRLLSRTLGKAYNFADPKSILMNGSHGGNIMTATMIGVLDPYGQAVSVLEKYEQPISSDLWLCIIDGGDNWRQDTLTTWNQDYRYHDTVVEGEGEDTVTWTFSGLTAGKEYLIQADWLINMAIRDQGYYSPSPARNTQVSSGSTSITKYINQNTFPEDEVIGLDDWANIGTIIAGADGTITLTLGTGVEVVDGNKNGDFVVAGRARIQPTDGTEAPQIIKYGDAAGRFQETVPNLFQWTTTSQLAVVNELNNGYLRDQLFDKFVEKNLRLIEPEFFIPSSAGAYQDVIEGLGNDATPDQDRVIIKDLRDKFKFRGYNVESYAIAKTGVNEWTITTTLAGARTERSQRK